ncbi:MAG: hypothetical protein CMF31_05740 [Kordiimonas sp.]|nr:hypothetical protein [Kordiimonas sp.]
MTKAATNKAKKAETSRRGEIGPEVLPVTYNDILAAIAAGLRDFRAAPLYGLAFAGIYALGGWILIILLLHFDLPFLVYPLAAGFALIGPFIATGFYAVSDLLEQEKTLSWGGVLGAVREAGGRDLGWMALVTGFSLIIWMDIAALLSFGFLGMKSMSATELINYIFTTPSGWLFLLIGNGVGAVIALAVFSFSVVSFPMLYDREVDFVTAMVTSVKVVVANPRPMIVWCVIIALLTGLSLLSGLLGLFAVLPVLGHASWHLYRRAVGT